jgi:hypothetical protein
MFFYSTFVFLEEDLKEVYSAQVVVGYQGKTLSYIDY